MLDVAAGTAGVSLQIANRTGARVIGLDLTEQMLRQGAVNVAAEDASGHVSLVNARAEQLPLADASVDALTFTYLLRYVTDPQATLNGTGQSRPAGRDHRQPGVPVPPSRVLAVLVAGAIPGSYCRSAACITGGQQWYRGRPLSRP